MLIIRPVEHKDVNDLFCLAKKAGEGMTSLPANLEVLSQKITNSQESFERDAPHPDDFFLLVMEDTQCQRVVGTASVYGRTGARQAFYAYRVMHTSHRSHSLDKNIPSDLLHLTNDYTGCSEVGSLFLDPDYRGNGLWLARSRYLLMGQFQERFAKHVIAELRGVIHTDGTSPFWDAIGQHFFDMSYAEADQLCAVRNNAFITELMPKYPIYTQLLPESAREVIGQPHAHGRRAMQFLEDEGFDYENVVDIFDGGPIMRGKIAKLNSVKQIKTVTLAKHNLEQMQSSTDTSENHEALVATTSLSTFRVWKTSVQLHESGAISLPDAIHSTLLPEQPLVMIPAAL